MKIAIYILLSLVLLTGCDNNLPPSNYSAEKSGYTVNSAADRNTNSFTEAQELFMYKTTIYTKTEARQNNVKIACDQLNGTIVAPNETFSFCNTLGPAKPENGYKKADTFDTDGDIYQEYGCG